MLDRTRWLSAVQTAVPAALGRCKKYTVPPIRFRRLE